MKEDRHLRREDYRASLSTHEGAETLPWRVLGHLVQSCPQCRAGWEDLSPTLRSSYLDLLSRVVAGHVPRRTVHRDDLPADLSAVLAEDREARHLRRRASKQLSELRNTRRRKRADKVRSATRRFRTRALAELLLEEARATVRNDPAEAESFAGLVPLVLTWAVGSVGNDWADALCALAEAHRANALRVAGHLPAAEQVFDRLHQAMALRPPSDAAVLGEIASLEGSLRIGQRRGAEAQHVLECAALAFRYAGEALGFAKAQIKLANLLQTEERPDEALRLLDETAQVVGEDAPPYLLTTLVAGRVTALCDLDRPSEARRILSAHLDAFENDELPHTAAALRFFEGRVALGLEEYATAEEHFSACSRVMLDLGRTYDAALSALYLADTYLAQGRTSELRRLATELVNEFAARGVAGQALKAAKLLARAAAAEEVSAVFLLGLRQRLQKVSGLRPAAL